MHRNALVASIAVGAVLAVPVALTVLDSGAAAAGKPPPAGPHIVEQADKLTGKVHEHGHNSAVPVAPFSDGCDRGYGTKAQCVPTRAPNNQPITCDYLRAAGWLVTPLAYTNDHLHLAVNGVVCG